MIFITVGAQLPFDRLVRAVDEIAVNLDDSVFAQVGNSKFIPSNMEFKSFLNPDEYNEKFMEADLIISHAGMGTIITALEYKKQIIVMPRNADLGEARNNHQFATAKRFSEKASISVASNKEELESQLNTFLNSSFFVKLEEDTGPHSSLLDKIRDFVLNE